VEEQFMQATDFADFHEPALEADEIRHSLLLHIIAHLRSQKHADGVKAWTLGGPGECAMQTPGYPIVLGNLSKAQCQRFAEALSGEDYHGVMGSGDTALWFAERAHQLGAEFSQEIPQLIQALPKIPLVPCVPGFPRQLTLNDLRLFRVWTISFMNEAVPSDPIPSEDASLADLQSKRHWIWTLENRPVSIAGICRRTRRTASINAVYTPPAHRNKGYGAAVTAIVARQIFSEKRIACLYADLRNPASNQCYAKLGFEAYCRSSVLIRLKQERS
jgi:GNAT superfamily N-acetyltransferase